MSNVWFNLEHFGFLRVSGVDAVKFLQGYTTCDLDALDNHAVQMGAICNIQGRMLASFLVIRQDSDLTLRMHRALIPKTTEFLSKYIVFSKATLSDISEDLYCYGSIESSELNQLSQAHGAFTIGLGNRTEHWLSEPIDSAQLAPQTDMAIWRDAEISAGVAWVDTASTEEYLPQMFAYDKLQAIDFEKGCYLGQEIVARLQYRGEVKKRLYRVDTSLIEQSGNWRLIAAGKQQSLVIMDNQGDAPIDLTLENQGSARATPL